MLKYLFISIHFLLVIPSVIWITITSGLYWKDLGKNLPYKKLIEEYKKNLG